MGERQTQNNKERIKDGDDIAHRIFGHPVTTNEVHAAQLGLVGVFAGLAYSMGYVQEALGASFMLIGIAFGVKALPDRKEDTQLPIAIKTKRHEPWWFTTPYIISFVIGVVVGGLV